MVLDIAAGAALIAFGFFAVFMSADSDFSDPKMLIVLLAGVLAIIGGAWLIINTLTLGIVLRKIAGLLIGGIGLFLIFGFPDSSDYQSGEMAFTGIFIGMVMTIIGVYLILF
ncbi:MAG: hypothetical protein QMD85_00355 [Candidatus Aenigmarchaeota archaeon]|nr:hypothetical protein [Candidatus Aenigmarchaeota archaeon]MDI6721968.1 hypothetical protein [Candidatus Aenigmarchaeota archaeon]